MDKCLIFQYIINIYVGYLLHKRKPKMRRIQNFNITNYRLQLEKMRSKNPLFIKMSEQMSDFVVSSPNGELPVFGMSKFSNIIGELRQIHR